MSYLKKYCLFVVLKFLSVLCLGVNTTMASHAQFIPVRISGGVATAGILTPQDYNIIIVKLQQ